jgi:restriction endonuclease, S subunit
LGDVAMVVGGGTPDTNNHKYWNGDIQWFTPSEIGRDKYVTNSLRTISEEGLNKSSAKLLPIGTILLSSRATVGECSINKVECTTNQGFQSLIPKEYFSKEFVFYLMQTKRKELIRKSCGSTFLEISANEVRKIKIAVPTSKEQEKISKLLALLDERISTQNKIIEKLESLIKGITQNIVRYNKDNVRLSDCLSCSSSTLQESDVSEHGTYPVYGANGVVGYLDNYNTENEAIYIIKDGSGVGSTSYVTGKCSATGTLNILRAKEGYSLQYLYYMLKVFNFEPYKTGMAIPHIYFKDYGKAKVFCPTYKEQLQYARLLSAIDKRLTVEHGLLTSLSLQKQYLLRQMFI